MGKKGIRVPLVLLSIIGAGVVAAGIHMYWTAKQQRFWPKTTGTILKVQIDTVRESSGTGSERRTWDEYVVKVHYTYVVKGKAFTTWQKVEKSKQETTAQEVASRYKPLSKRTIRYNPKDPKDSVIKARKPIEGISLVVVGIAIWLTVAAIIVIRRIKARSAQSRDETPTGAGQERLNEDLIEAVESGERQKVRTLLQQGADGNAAYDDGRTALMLVQHNVETVRLLLQHGVDVEAHERHDGMTALMYAVQLDATSVVSLLLDSGADIEAKDDYGRTALFFATETETANILIKHRANVNARDEDGQTPLMQVVTNGNLEMAELLLKQGANVTLRDGEGHSILDLAEGNDGMQNLLRSYQTTAT